MDLLRQQGKVLVRSLYEARLTALVARWSERARWMGTLHSSTQMVPRRRACRGYAVNRGHSRPNPQT
jgi:hypothetical protein